MTAARPLSRSQARSVTVDRDPGSTTRSAPATTSGVGGDQHLDAGLGGEGVDVGDVGHPRQPDHGDPQRPRSGRSGAASRRSRGCPRRPARRPGSHGRTPANGTPVRARQLLQPGLQHGRVAAELVDHERSDHAPGPPRRAGRRCRTARRSTPPRSMSPTTTTGQSNRPGQAEVDVVAGPQVDLGRRARRPRRRPARTAPPARRTRRRRPRPGALDRSRTHRPRARRPAARGARRGTGGPSPASAAPGSSPSVASTPAAWACRYCARPISDAVGADHRSCWTCSAP